MEMKKYHIVVGRSGDDGPMWEKDVEGYSIRDVVCDPSLPNMDTADIILVCPEGEWDDMRNNIQQGEEENDVPTGTD